MTELKKKLLAIVTDNAAVVVGVKNGVYLTI
jgi:hypothetical protein